MKVGLGNSVVYSFGSSETQVPGKIQCHAEVPFVDCARLCGMVRSVQHEVASSELFSGWCRTGKLESE